MTLIILYAYNAYEQSCGQMGIQKLLILGLCFWKGL